ncbi:ketopantoate reductase family protein [Rossellomorea sp. YZS02]|uniref:ketopantoate reductase family protein n=1 Tax=Rossellomorea sp. YZS02 TaxID=3097358 RepID=UPI002A17C27D|nr:ketopantoate reductase family protein [Rossellomorea sp. YZS02]MDX8344787.1 ketopantoate reductase family protein [Rossellomorea sp. YZS02]
MRILIVGAGAVGGYFGGRLIEKGEDVTFLVRERREHQLREHGLQIESVHGDFHSQPKTIKTGEKAEPFDAVILSTKAYHLKGAIESLSPYVGEDTMILPLLNGMSHVDDLIEAFGEEKLIGGLCFVESTLDGTGKVLQTSPIHDLVFGERDGERTERITKLEQAFSGTKANFRLSDTITQEMWHKYLFITTLSGVTSLYRAPIGPIREMDEGADKIKAVLSQAATVMRKLDAPLSENIEEALFDKIKGMGYSMKSSLQRDMEKNLSVEADHLYGYLLRTAESHDVKVPDLRLIYGNLKIYEVASQ